LICSGPPSAVAAKVAPTNAEIHRLRIARQWEQCSTLCSEYLLIEPNDPVVLGVQSECQIKLGRFDEARITLEKLDNCRAKGGGPNLYLHAYFAERTHNLERARILIDRVWQTDHAPLDGVQRLRANIYSQLGNHDEVFKSMPSLPHRDGLQYLLSKGKDGRASEVSPFFYELMTRGLGREIAWLIRDLPPDKLPSDAAPMAAGAAQSANNCPIAIKWWKHVLETNPAYEQEHGLSVVGNYLVMGASQEALNELDRLAPSSLKNPRFWLLRSEALIKLQRLTQAEQILDRGIKSFPDNAELYYNRSEVEWVLGRVAQAKEDLDKAIELDPHKEVFRAVRINREFGLPDQKHVLADFDALIELTDSAHKASYLSKKARFLNSMGDLVSAVSVLGQALRYAPNDKNILRLKQSYCQELKRNKITCAGCESQK
jgi:tetratricopeptide (TPR) repeat protein